MNDAPDPPWTPEPRLLAAYFDGELEGRDDAADLRARLEIWLETHPDAAEQWAKHHRLQMLWLDTTPAEPNTATWRRVLDQIAAKRHQPAAISMTRTPWPTVGIMAASVLVVVGFSYGVWRSTFSAHGTNDAVTIAPLPHPDKTLPNDIEVFQVATAGEVSILHIEGADTKMLVVGEMPVHGALELAAPGEVRITYVQPEPLDHIRTHVQEGPNRPMIWAKLEAE